MFHEGKKEEYLMSKVKLYTFLYAEPFVCHYFYRVYGDNLNYINHNDRSKIRLY